MITEEELILNEVFEDDINRKITTYCLSFNDFEIKVFRTQTYSNEVGDLEDEFKFISEIELTEQDEEIIKWFCAEND